MIALQIQEIKHFMNQLLTTDQFHPFCLVEAHITKDVPFHIDGTLVLNNLDQDKKDDYETNKLVFIPFMQIQSLLFQLIKGSTTPSFMKFVLKLHPSLQKDPAFTTIYHSSSESDSFFLNIVFLNGNLQLTSGFSSNYIFQDNFISKEWDNSLKCFLKNCKIFYEMLN